jgi:predicted Fe-Mo cluster-binding NifX family protein
MRIAISEWHGRVSPVLDFAGNLVLIDIETNREIRREERPLGQTDSLFRAREISNLGADILICGAVSAPLEAGLASSGLRVVGFICGSIDDVVAAFLKGELAGPGFRMPGCRRWRGRLQQGGNAMQRAFGPTGGGRGSGRGRMRGRGGDGGTGGPFAAGPGGSCVCQNCGEKVPHTAGQPCKQLACPKCGATMMRA